MPEVNEMWSPWIVSTPFIVLFLVYQAYFIFCLRKEGENRLNSVRRQLAEEQRLRDQIRNNEEPLVRRAQRAAN